MPYALKITWRDVADTAYLCDVGTQAVLRFAQRADAEAKRRSLLELIGHEVQAIDIVPAPRRARAVGEA